MLGAAAAGAAAALLPTSTASAATKTSAVKPLVDAALASGLANGIPGLVIGAFSGRDEYVAGAGTTAGPGSPAPDGRTIYQLGSVTKTLHRAPARRGRRGRPGPAGRPARPLPAARAAPAQAGPRGDHPAPRRDAELRTPPLPPNLLTMPGFDPLDPYAGYTEKDLADGLRATKLVNQPGTAYLYSNLGVALLGLAMANLAGADYASTVHRFATAPLGLHDTTMTLTREQLARKATGFAADGTPTPDWQQPMFTPPEPAGLRLGLAWHMTPLLTSKRTMVWHNGGTGGFATFTGFCPDTGTGVTVLANIAKFDQVDQVAALLLDDLNPGTATAAGKP